MHQCSSFVFPPPHPGTKMLSILRILLLTLYMCSCTGVLLPPRDLLVVTGATGTLGRAFCMNFIETCDPESTTILAGCRDTEAGDELFARYPNVFTFECNFDGITRPDLPPFYLDCLSEFQSVTLINNAAVCLEGLIFLSFLPTYFVHSFFLCYQVSLTARCSLGSSKDILSKSILVNAVGPLEFSTTMIENCRNNDHTRCTIVNISSGDGEISYLHSDIQKRIKKVKTLNEWESLARSLVIFYDEGMEYAFGPTPMYSLSKAMLNKGTYLLHNDKHKQNEAKLLAVCPGNFKSPMSTKDELQNNYLTSEDAVLPIVEMLRKGFGDGDNGNDGDNNDNDDDDDDDDDEGRYYLHRGGERVFQIE